MVPPGKLWATNGPITEPSRPKASDIPEPLARIETG